MGRQRGKKAAEAAAALAAEAAAAAAAARSNWSPFAKATVAWGYTVMVYAIVVAVWRVYHGEAVLLDVVAWKRAMFALVFVEATKYLATNESSMEGWAEVLYGIICVFIGVLAANTYNRLIRGNSHKQTSMEGKVVLVTGANSGIGLETAKELMRMGAYVVFACRTEEKAREAILGAIKELKQEIQKVGVKSGPTDDRPSAKGVGIFMKLDMSDLDSVRAFAQELNSQQHLKIDVLVLNAGLIGGSRREESAADGLETTIGVNHLAHFLLTNLLLNKMESSTDPRVVVVSSVYHKYGKIDWDDLLMKQNWSAFRAYCSSKLMNVMFATELQRRLDLGNKFDNKEGNTSSGNGSSNGSSSSGRSSGSRLWKGTNRCIVHSVHPGLVMTSITKNMNPVLRFGYWLVTPLMLLLQKRPKQGAYGVVHCTTNAELREVGHGGLFFSNLLPMPMHEMCEDEEACARLWDASAALVGLEGKKKS